MLGAETNSQLTRLSARPSVASSSLRAVAEVAGFCALTGLAAQVKIPVPGTPVPMTLQLLAVLLAGFCLPASRAAGAMVLYVVVGWLGMPVLAPASAGLAGVTGGYLLGFIGAAYVVSKLSGRSVFSIRLLVAGGVGTAIVLACGMLWQVLLFGVTLSSAVQIGVLPFAPKAAVELGLAVVIARAILARRADRTRQETAD
jgi:biotin transport system substrate-specific component